MNNQPNKIIENPFDNTGAIKAIADKMAEGETRYLRELRKLVVDLDLPQMARKIDIKLFTALFFSKLFIAEIWENLATDASFDFNADEDRLKKLTIELGGVLQDIFSDNFTDSLISFRMGKIIKGLYGYFQEISDNPKIVFTGDGYEHP